MFIFQLTVRLCWCDIIVMTDTIELLLRSYVTIVNEENEIKDLYQT
jgi:hypothetical protein